MEQLFSPNFNERPKNTVIDTIIIHYTEIDEAETKKFFQDKKKEVSSHFLITENGIIYKFVDIDKRAWHAGLSSFRGMTDINNNSIGIELVNDGKSEFKEAQYKSLIQLIKTLKKEIASIKDSLILGHSDIAPLRKKDPGKFFDWKILAGENIGLYHDLKFETKNNKILAKFGDQNEQVKTCQNSLKKFGYDISVDGKFLDKTQKILYNFKTHFLRENIDEIWDSFSFAVIENYLKKI